MAEGALVRNFGREELLELGLRSVGDDVSIDRSVLFFEPQRVDIGSHVRIDAYCVITTSANGFVSIGSHVHISAGVYLFGGAGIDIGDFVGLSARTVVFSTNDDYSGATLTGPTVPDDLRRVHAARVKIGSHVVVGAASIVLPGVEIGLGAAVGALSLVKKPVAPFTIVAGNPLRHLGDRKRTLLELEGQVPS
jgi:galactoside O-acetyltransferase